ncbi:hypothetical protein [Rhodococcus sp. B10]|uniref:hypothetical protein n=1 Tax=Rhodococcus sp. B10 TaxID=2695876 RepID=UPI001430E092|nr:hypothetical protein [Rhodococcus sp. B10]NIL76794.1 hypothetical protein [Rhodococcus sp. B10]
MTTRAAKGKTKSTLGDTIDNLTGLQVKRVQSLTGCPIHEPDDYYQLLFAIDYVRRLPVEQLRSWGPDALEGFERHLEEHTTKQVADALGANEPDSDPKDAPAS